MQRTSAERWKPVVGYEGLYEISDRGRVASLRDHLLRSRRKVLRGSIYSTGYKMVVLHDRGRKRAVNIGALVLEAFIGQRPTGYD